MVLFLAGLTALAFLSVGLLRKQTARPLRAILLVAAMAIVTYITWMLVSGALK